MSPNNGGQSNSGARVILVGRTGLDQTLRRDEDIEIVRARNTLDAIGELANPIDDDSPRDATVIVGAESDPGIRATALVDSLRMIDPEVRVLVMGRSTRGVYDGVILSPDVPHTSLRAMLRRRQAQEVPPLQTTLAEQVAAPEPASQPGASLGLAEDRIDIPAIEPARGTISLTSTEPSDVLKPPLSPTSKSTAATDLGLPEPVIVLPPAATTTPSPVLAPAAAAMLADLSARQPQRAEPAVEPSRERAPPGAPASTPSPALSGTEALDDHVLVEALMTGRDVLLPALALLRRRLGDGSLAFVPLAPGVEPSAAEGRRFGEAPVSHRGRVLGTLAGRSAIQEDLLAAARWLGAWLALREQQEQLREAAFLDDLTGAQNRRYFDRFLAAAIERAKAERRSVTVLFFDIDNFKKYNDAYGHGAGDEILRETVRLIKSVIRPTDRVCRFGGDEFAVVFFEPEGPREAGSQPPSSIWGIASRFQRQICEHRFPKLAEQAPGTLTISGGLATYPWDGATPLELVAKADALAIESKRRGKNVITLGPGAEKVCRLDFEAGGGGPSNASPGGQTP